MIAVLKNGTTPSQIQHLVDWLKNMNLDVHISEGSEVTILGLVGDTSRVDIDLLKSLEMVETVKRISEPFKLANRKFHPKDTIIEAGNARIGGGYFAMIAGPCSVESEEQIIAVASAVKCQVRLKIGHLVRKLVHHLRGNVGRVRNQYVKRPPFALMIKRGNQIS